MANKSFSVILEEIAKEMGIDVQDNNSNRKRGRKNMQSTTTKRKRNVGKIAIMAAAVTAGIGFFNTADISTYGDGQNVGIESTKEDTKGRYLDELMERLTNTSENLENYSKAIEEDGNNQMFMPDTGKTYRDKMLLAEQLQAFSDYNNSLISLTEQANLAESEGDFDKRDEIIEQINNMMENNIFLKIVDGDDKELSAKTALDNWVYAAIDSLNEKGAHVTFKDGVAILDDDGKELDRLNIYAAFNNYESLEKFLGNGSPEIGDELNCLAVSYRENAPKCAQNVNKILSDSKKNEATIEFTIICQKQKELSKGYGTKAPVVVQDTQNEVVAPTVPTEPTEPTAPITEEVKTPSNDKDNHDKDKDNHDKDETPKEEDKTLLKENDKTVAPEPNVVAGVQDGSVEQAQEENGHEKTEEESFGEAGATGQTEAGTTDNNSSTTIENSDSAEEEVFYESYYELDDEAVEEIFQEITNSQSEEKIDEEKSDNFDYDDYATEANDDAAANDDPAAEETFGEEL